MLYHLHTKTSFFSTEYMAGICMLWDPMLVKSNKHFYILYLRMKKEEGLVSKNQLIGYKSAIRCIGPIDLHRAGKRSTWTKFHQESWKNWEIIFMKSNIRTDRGTKLILMLMMIQNIYTRTEISPKCFLRCAASSWLIKIYF